MAHDFATGRSLASRYGLRPVDRGYLLPVRSVFRRMSGPRSRTNTARTGMRSSQLLNKSGRDTPRRATTVVETSQSSARAIGPVASERPSPSHTKSTRTSIVATVFCGAKPSADGRPIFVWTAPIVWRVPSTVVLTASHPPDHLCEGLAAQRRPSLRRPQGAGKTDDDRGQVLCGSAQTGALASGSLQPNGLQGALMSGCEL
jgi:hypothetical protein